jgi:O-antigen/teichoic acid export membrane protein
VSSTLKETEPLFHESVTAIRLVTIATAITSISAFLGAILQAMRRIDLANLIGVPLLWLRFILFVVIALKGGGLVALGWANVAMSLFSLFWFVIFISRVLKGQGILSRSAIRPGRIHGLGRFIFYSGIAKLGDLIRNQSTILLLGLAALGGAPSVAAIFALVSTLTKTSSQAIVGFADSASPRLARFASSPDEMRPMIASFGAVLGAMFSAFAFAFFFLGAPFITLWAPPDDYMDLLVPFMQLVSAIFMVRAGRMMINRPLRALNRMEYTGVGQLIESVLTLALAIILMLSMGVLGVLVARLAVSSVYLLIAAPLIMRKVALIEYRDYYWGCYCRPFLAAALGAIPLAIMVMNVKIDSWLTLVGVGFPGCVLMCVTIYFIGIDREKRREIMSRVRDVSGT